jgi:hypothetical protein
MGSVQNIVRVALMQIGVIVAGILGAGICHKIHSITEQPMPHPASALYEHGVYGFFIPILWAGLTLSICSRDHVSDAAKALTFWSGVILLIALAIFVVLIDGRSILLLA